jgi:hypothetical protein
MSPTAPLTADRVLRLSRDLPRWDPDLDDDPRWLRPPSAVGLHPTPLTGHLVRARGLLSSGPVPPPSTVPVEAILYSTQTWLRIDALAYYIVHPTRLFDPDGWFGTDLPVLSTLPDDAPGYVILDGNNRIGAARLRGDLTLTAHVVDPGPSPV